MTLAVEPVVTANNSDDARVHPDASLAPPAWLMATCCLMLIVCVVPWRQKAYFSGAVDPVVMAKAVLGVAALVLAGYMARRRMGGSPIGASTIAIATAYLVVSVIGGWAAGSMGPSLVIAVRVIMLLITVSLLHSTFPPERLVPAVIGSLAGVAFVAAATGSASIASGRLEGGVPALASNEIAFACGMGVLYVMHHASENPPRLWHLAAGIGGCAALWLTGSRTTTATFVLAAITLVLQARVVSIPAFMTAVAAVPVVAWVALSTPVVTGLILRGGDSNVSTLSSRTIAWQAALSFDGASFQRWFGGGLALKHIPVGGQYWNSQILDSSWISALVQVGIVGLILAAAWVGLVTRRALAAPRPWRPLWVATLVFMVPRSALESGLFDASAAFIIFTLLSFQVEPAGSSRRMSSTTTAKGRS